MLLLRLLRCPAVGLKRWFTSGAAPLPVPRVLLGARRFRTLAAACLLLPHQARPLARWCTPTTTAPRVAAGAAAAAAARGGRSAEPSVLCGDLDTAARRLLPPSSLPFSHHHTKLISFVWIGYRYAVFHGGGRVVAWRRRTEMYGIPEIVRYGM
ncbi:hypothetical protein N657DRAFT_88200 [Parathielavia appendiculata]|uniref:Uncharacterized protein n=1 Tax=Parathielavia appendiculata TaxID=2587402 RepID=A0AAN6UAX7_9PEZI|nr:hypothetical protein N657DRAFT_88200 [Parathielavia appendiculata]